MKNVTLCLLVLLSASGKVSAQDCADPNAIPISNSSISLSRKTNPADGNPAEIIISAQINGAKRDVVLTGTDAESAIDNTVKDTFAPFLVEQKFPNAACSIPFCIKQRPVLNIGTFFDIECSQPSSGVYACKSRATPYAASIAAKIPINKSALDQSSSYELDAKSTAVKIAFGSNNPKILFNPGSATFSLESTLTQCNGPIQTVKNTFITTLQVPDQGLVFIQPVWQALLGECVQTVNFSSGAQTSTVDKGKNVKDRAFVYTRGSAPAVVSASLTIGFKFGNPGVVGSTLSLQTLTQPLGEVRIIPLTLAQVDKLDSAYRYLPEFHNDSTEPVVLVGNHSAQVGIFASGSLPPRFLSEILAITNLTNIYDPAIKCKDKGWTAFEDTVVANDKIQAGAHFVVAACKEQGDDAIVFYSTRTADGQAGAVTTGSLSAIAQDASNITPCLPDGQCEWWSAFLTQLKASNHHFGYALRRR